MSEERAIYTVENKAQGDAVISEEMEIIEETPPHLDGDCAAAGCKGCLYTTDGEVRFSIEDCQVTVFQDYARDPNAKTVERRKVLVIWSRMTPTTYALAETISVDDLAHAVGKLRIDTMNFAVVGCHVCGCTPSGPCDLLGADGQGGWCSRVQASPPLCSECRNVYGGCTRQTCGEDHERARAAVASL